MDPVTIISLASGSATVGKLLLESAESLWRFIEQARDVDQSIRNLQRETAGLSRTLKAISDALDQTAIKDHRTIAQDYAMVWESLDGSVDDCKGTATVMQVKLEGLHSSKRLSFLSQAWKQYRLGFKEEEIKTLRSQIQTHSTSLHLALLMINV
jgi:Fungal N-terminal domain of STAND proteins